MTLKDALNNYLSTSKLSMRISDLENLEQQDHVNPPALILNDTTVAGLAVQFARLVREDPSVNIGKLSGHDVVHIDMAIEGLIRLAWVMNESGLNLEVYEANGEEVKE